MFSYLGSKSKIVHLYPEPVHDLIIEPFAGSARYALKYFDRNVILYDKSEYVFAVWNYLIQASSKDVMGLPLIKDGENVNDYDLTQAEKWLIGFCLTPGKSNPYKRSYGRSHWEQDRKRMASFVDKINHWKIYQDDYFNIPNQKASWFIDPPYQWAQKTTKSRYVHWQVDFDKLANFTHERCGQVIACGGENDNWLDFLYLTGMGGSHGWYEEYFYHNHNICSNSL